MSTSLRRLNERERGQEVPVSIGTALAIEATFGVPTPEGEPRLKPGEQPPIHKYGALWINLRTLLRNLMASMPTADRDSVMPDDLITAMQEEMRVIESAVTRFTNGQTLVVFYLCTYNGLKRRFPRALLKEAKTEKQKAEQAIERHCMEHFMESDDGHDVRRHDVTIEAGGPKSLILTHLPVDLLSRAHFEELTLLESHTGKLKRRSEWSTKLTGKKLERIPFNQFTLQLFGDGTMFATQPYKLKEAVLALATEDRWTTVTTEEKIRYSVMTLYDPRAKSFLLTLLSR